MDIGGRQMVPWTRLQGDVRVRMLAVQKADGFRA